MSESLQDHRLKYDEPLLVPPSVPQPPQLVPKRLDKAPPDYLAWRVIETRWHDLEVTPPRPPRHVVADAAVKVGARVGAKPVSVDLLEAKILQGWVVSRLVPLLPLTLCCCRRLVVRSFLSCASGDCVWRESLLLAAFYPLRLLPPGRVCGVCCVYCACCIFPFSPHCRR